MKFEELSLNDRILLISEYAECLCWIRFYDYTRTLYTLHGSFVDVWYNNHLMLLEDIKLLDYSQIDPYLTGIQLDDLLTKS